MYYWSVKSAWKWVHFQLWNWIKQSLSKSMPSQEEEECLERELTKEMQTIASRSSKSPSPSEIKPNVNFNALPKALTDKPHPTPSTAKNSITPLLHHSTSYAAPSTTVHPSPAHTSIPPTYVQSWARWCTFSNIWDHTCSYSHISVALFVWRSTKPHNIERWGKEKRSYKFYKCRVTVAARYCRG